MIFGSVTGGNVMNAQFWGKRDIRNIRRVNLNPLQRPPAHPNAAKTIFLNPGPKFPQQPQNRPVSLGAGQVEPEHGEPLALERSRGEPERGVGPVALHLQFRRCVSLPRGLLGGLVEPEDLVRRFLGVRERHAKQLECVQGEV